jgi:hypothetical protein
MGLAQMKRKFFFHFPNLIFNAKTFPGNPRKCFKARKILKKFQENSQIQIGTRINPNKIFGAHENDFKAF